LKIAIVRLTSMGDIIFCMAALQVIKRRMPDSEITWIADKKFADMLDYNPDLTGVIKIGLKDLKRNFSVKNLKNEYQRIKQPGRFDITIDLHGMIKSAVITRISGRISAGFGLKVVKEPIAAMFYDRAFNIPFNLNRGYRYTLLAASALGFCFDEQDLMEKRPFLFYKPEDILFSNEYFSNNLKNIVFVTASTELNRDYPKEKFVNIANALKQNILICHGNDAELETARYIAENSQYVRVLPRMSLSQLKAAISRADLLIGVDTGPTHIAWANNIPSIVILGPTPADCIYATSRNKILKSRSQANEKRMNKNDFSIREIEESEILKHAEKLLS
jgi:heptosyltransferase-1